VKGFVGVSPPRVMKRPQILLRPFPFRGQARFGSAAKFARIQWVDRADRSGPSGVAKRNPFTAIAHGHSLAEAIVDAIREPLLVLDPGLRVIAASRSFYRTFAVKPRKTEGRLLFELGDGQWNIPALRTPP
jgi:PAS domain-containing protein